MNATSQILAQIYENDDKYASDCKRYQQLVRSSAYFPHCNKRSLVEWLLTLVDDHMAPYFPSTPPAKRSSTTALVAAERTTTNIPTAEYSAVIPITTDKAFDYVLNLDNLMKWNSDIATAHKIEVREFEGLYQLTLSIGSLWKC